MRDYEVMFIVHPDLDEAAFKDVVEKVKKWIMDAGGSLTKETVWGKRRLAYAIRKQKDGQYMLLEVKMAPSFSSELERNLRLTEPVLRFMITAVE